MNRHHRLDSVSFSKMNGHVHIALVGDYNPGVKAHRAIPEAIRLATDGRDGQAEFEWLNTESLDQEAEHQLSPFEAIWCVPNSPYASMNGALRAIQFARETGRPFLGTCGGFQHALIEFVRNVLGHGEAGHTESNPDAAMPLVSPLACSLAGANAKIRLQPGSRLNAIYGSLEIAESYHCNFGLNRRYESLLANSSLEITGRDNQGEVRAVELSGHPFFIATLFQPELSALAGAAHPLVRALLDAATNHGPPSGYALKNR